MNEAFPIKHKVETVITVNYYDLEEYIEKHYGLEYSFQSADEARNGSSLKYTVSKRTLTEYGEKELDSSNKGWEPYPTLLLTDMCNKNLLPECELIVVISY